MTITSRTAREYCTQLMKLAYENERLQKMVESLTLQLELAREAGALPDAAMAKAWIDAMAKGSPELWKLITVGSGHWNEEDGHPAADGLTALLMDLRAIPGTDEDARFRWDMNHRKKRPDLVGKYPPKFNQTLDTVYVLRQQGDNKSAELLFSLRKGMRTNSKAYLLITAFVLMYRAEAPARLAGNAHDALSAILGRMNSATAAQEKKERQRTQELLEKFLHGGNTRSKALQVLGLTNGATDSEIKAAYRRLAKQHHPDMPNGDADKFGQIQKAYELLTNKQS